ncbi:uncharacterized protein PITG_01712 [Phytophthora infestans T30-4]|uniref:Tudor domain-containing protein n=1 Tax=Phytophthora infestans (strain T30-4) TaxID=403677 RepID=D0MTW8_PHYIT|nr:uncharacterized protein PITG_01712 [Phytophthora infestans T30-4]EEY61415.1 conserved hypothetical protein [Phytophthora infestans T30-4]|eukprot:XP_002908332.1 conserved hypothetical protein [Phytophthora infestans T30-4]
MKRSDRHPMRWVNQPIFKLEIDSHGHETQIRGKVMNYCPSSVRYLLMYEDGSSDGVPVDEIEDHVPLLLRLPNKRRRLVSADRQAAAQREECAAFHERPKRRKVSSVAKSKAATFDKEAVFSRFIRTTLCELTEVLDVSDDQRQTLMTALESGKEQPHAALTQYDQEGGLDALSHTLLNVALPKHLHFLPVLDLRVASIYVSFCEISSEANRAQAGESAEAEWKSVLKSCTGH